MGGQTSNGTTRCKTQQSQGVRQSGASTISKNIGISVKTPVIQNRSLNPNPLIDRTFVDYFNQSTLPMPTNLFPAGPRMMETAASKMTKRYKPTVNECIRQYELESSLKSPKTNFFNSFNTPNSLRSNFNTHAETHDPNYYTNLRINSPFSKIH